MKLLILIFLSATHITYGQSVTGQLVGLEKDPLILNMNGDPIYKKVGGKKIKEWFHEITIDIKDSLILVTQVPVYLRNGKLRYAGLESDFYYYSGVLRRNDTCFYAQLLMDSCKGCSKQYLPFLPVAKHVDTAQVLHRYRLETKDWGRHRPIFVSPLDDMVLNYTLCPDSSGLLVNTSYESIQFKRKEELPTTRVLPIVGLDVGAIGCILPSALVRAEGTLLNIRINSYLFE